MRLGALGYALGTWMLQRQAGLPGSAALALFALAAVALLLLARSPRIPREGEGGTDGAPWLYGGLLRRTAQLGAFALLGFIWAAIWAHTRLADRLDPSWEGRDVGLTGVIAAMPQPFEHGFRFKFDVERAAPAGAQVPKRVLLAWYTGMTRGQFQETQPVHAGERWQLVARLKRPHGQVNPAGFDYEAWLLERGIRATGTVRIGRRIPPPRRVEAMVYRPATIVERAREHIRERMRRVLAGARYAGILAALAIGDRRAIEQQDWDVFTRTGTNHLMSISGLHVTMVSGLAALLVLFGWRRAAALALRFPAQKAAALAGLAAAFAYCLVSGFAVPAQRTLYMVAAVALALLCDRTSSASRVLALALFAVLVFDPWAVLAPGFWLSFGAVALIFYTGTRRRRHWLLRWGAMQWAITVGLAPLLLVLFGRVSLAAPLANAVAIPVISLIVTPLALAGAVFPVAFALHWAHVALEWLMPTLHWLAGLKGAVWVQQAPAAWTLPLAAAGVLWLLLPRGVPARWVGALLFLPLASTGPSPPARGAAAVTVFDVGQGLSVLVRTRSHALLYDAGPAWAGGTDSGQRVILPVLRAWGLSALDAIVISHDDTDHSGGALSVMRSVPAALLYSSLPAFDPIALAAPYRLPCADGRHWSWDGVRFEFLHPRMARYAGRYRSGNGMSCVLKLSTAQGTVLLTGDLDARNERELVARHAGALAAQVLVVPHHGSRSSSTAEFVREVAPQVAVFSVGYLNRFGHPRPEILDRYRRQGSRVERTDRSGAIAVGIDGRGLSVRSQRESSPHYWYGR